MSALGSHACSRPAYRNLDGQASRVDESPRAGSGGHPSQGQRLSCPVYLADDPRSQDRGSLARPVQLRTSGSQGVAGQTTQGTPIKVLHRALGSAARASGQPGLDIPLCRRGFARRGCARHSTRSSPARAAGRLRSTRLRSVAGSDGPILAASDPRSNTSDGLVQHQCATPTPAHGMIASEARFRLRAEPSRSITVHGVFLFRPSGKTRP